MDFKTDFKPLTVIRTKFMIIAFQLLLKKWDIMIFQKMNGKLFDGHSCFSRF